MHEAGLAQSIINVLLSHIEEKRITGKIQRVFLKIGQLNAVVPENMQFMFTTLSEGGALQGVELVIEEIAARAKCGNCQTEFVLSEPVFWCPNCHAPSLTLLAGEELLIDSVEVE